MEISIRSASKYCFAIRFKIDYNSEKPPIDICSFEINELFITKERAKKLFEALKEVIKEDE